MSRKMKYLVLLVQVLILPFPAHVSQPLAVYQDRSHLPGRLSVPPGVWRYRLPSFSIPQALTFVSPAYRSPEAIRDLRTRNAFFEVFRRIFVISASSSACLMPSAAA
ncbi:hypothetical protein [Klebsiella phage vB_KshKPC-M]|nr:hypothetical protein [Klebsiella phage vB_KshKPC-M]